MPNLNDFINEFKHGFQKACRFRVQVFVQPGMVLNIISEAGLLGVIDAALAIPQTVKWLASGILCDAARLPDRGFSLVKNEMYGITENFPYHTETTPLECTFLMPKTSNIFQDCGVPRFFNFWQNQIHNLTNGPESGLDFRFPANYYATILLTMLDQNDNSTITYQFDNVYPSTVQSVQIGWEHDGFAKLPVQFTFSYWKVLPHLESVGLDLLGSVGNIINRIL